jgi:monoamine oxidase
LRKAAGFFLWKMSASSDLTYDGPTKANATSLKRPASSAKAFRAKKTRVIVLGAGMAGLAAAKELQQRGYQVLVVEARDRPGGRLKGGVKTNDREGGNEGMKTLPSQVINPDTETLTPLYKARRKDTTTPVDLGGALIHGIDGNPIYALARQMGIPTKPVSDCLLFNETGWPVDTKEDERISTLFNECLEETFDRLARLEGLPNIREPSASKGRATLEKKEEPQPLSKSVRGTKEQEMITRKKSTDIAQAEPSSFVLHTTPPLLAHELRTISPPSLTDDGQHAAMTEEEKPEETSNDDAHVAKTKSTRNPYAKKAQGTTHESNQKGDAAATTRSDQPNSSATSVRVLASAGTITASATAGMKSTDAPDISSGPVPSFGDVFEAVCADKGAPVNYPVFQWHQANLEVSCGASFPYLGYKWNDDEPYGFDGPHVAVKSSWKPIMEGLAEGLHIMYKSPVKQVAMVVPDPPPEPPMTWEASLPSPNEVQVGNQRAVSNGVLSPKPSLKRKRSMAPPPLPIRQSRRLRGDDADARRSTRANKGQKVERFVVNQFSKGTYKDHGSPTKSPGQRNDRDRQEGPRKLDGPHTTVQVTLHDGTVLEAEGIICTLPLGILKLEATGVGESKFEQRIKTGTSEKAEIEDNPDLDDGSCAVRFFPPLSTRKQIAIQRLGCGLLNKCVLSFPHVFWQDSDFLGLAHPAKSYLVLNAATFTNKPILTFMYGGTFAEEIEEWTDNEIVADCMEVVRIIVGKRDIPAPLDYAVTRWGHERYSRMSFSYVPPGVDGMLEFRAMSEAVYDPLEPRKPVIMFAGEHTTPYHPSTIHGAFMSGIREAYRLDLVVEAEANDYLDFDEDHLYQHTFAVRRLYHSAKSPVARAPKQGNIENETRLARQRPNGDEPQMTSRRQHRGRGAAMVMNLRERPDADRPEEPTAQSRMSTLQSAAKSVPKNGVSAKPAKRSRRSVYVMQSNVQKSATPGTSGAVATTPSADVEGDAQRKKQLASLESRTLMRALESYGRNYPYIQSIVLPIYGNPASAQKTVPQLRARCQQLFRSIASSASATLPKRLVDSWVAKDVFIPPPPPPPVEDKPKTAKASKTRAVKPPVEGTRKSYRTQKHRTLLNL